MPVLGGCAPLSEWRNVMGSMVASACLGLPRPASLPPAPQVVAASLVGAIEVPAGCGRRSLATGDAVVPVEVVRSPRALVEGWTE